MRRFPIYLGFFARRAACWLLCLMSVLSVAVPARATDYVWTGATSTDWNTPDNWLPRGVPGAADGAIVGAQRAVNANQTVTVARLTLAPASQLQGSGNITVTGSASLTDVKLSGTGALKIASGAVMNLESVGTNNGLISGLLGFLVNTVLNLLIDKPIVNAGTINWNRGNLKIGANWQNNAGAVLDIRTDSVLAQNSLLGVTFINSGTLLKSSGGTTTLAPVLQNSGTIEFLAGTLEAQGGFTQTAGFTQFKGGHLKTTTALLRGGKIGGIGTLTGNLQNDGGIVAPGFSPGTITINGNYTQSASGVLDMEIGGLSAGTQYDQMVVNGTAYLGGTLNIVQYNGFAPSAGTSFQLIKYYSSSGTFAVTNNVFSSAGVYFTTTKTPSYLVAQTYGDTGKPSVAVSAPLGNVARSSFPSVSGTASDSGSGLDKVTLMLYRFAAGSTGAGYWNGTSWDATYNAAKHERFATGTSSWSLSLPALTQGQYNVRATASDKAKNSASTSTVNFWVDSTAPTSASFLAPLSGATVSDLNTVTISASDGSTGSGISSVMLQIKNGSGNYWTGSGWASKATNLATSFNGTNWTRSNTSSTPMPTGSLLTTGTYQLIATATDRAGLTKIVTINVTVGVKTTAKSSFTRATSGAELSFVEASGTQAQLYFTAPLRTSTPESFSVTSDGEPLFVVRVDTAGVMVTLHFSRALTAGESVVITWQNVSDESGHLLCGQTLVVAR